MKLLIKYFELKLTYLECKYHYKREYISMVYQLRIQYLKAKIRKYFITPNYK